LALGPEPGLRYVLLVSQLGTWKLVAAMHCFDE
jgi:hypothetical protein